ncbi:hypothetical protein [Streptomyces sp. NPDC060010]|uniref:hypothetical protein n=1 Tax=Streptomyces sp. NPDC060010 TaxID=3347036 RepID=UPI00369ADCA0
MVDEDGELVDKMVADHRFNPVLRNVDKVKYPVMATLDPHRDTWLNHLQCESLIKELEGGVEFLDEMGVNRDATFRLVRLCEITQGKPGRRLLFIGD